MLIVGAKGLAKEVLEFLLLNNETKNLVFYDDVNLDGPDFLYGKYPILKSLDDAKQYFANTDNRFTLGVGLPQPRYQLFHKFTALGAEPFTLISNTSGLGRYEMEFSEGVTVGYNCIISNSVSIGRGSFINAQTTIGHDSKIGEFCDICPSVKIAGNTEIGDYTFIGTGVIFNPNLKIGRNVSITAGSVVRKNVPDNSIVHGNPSKIIGKRPAFQELK